LIWRKGRGEKFFVDVGSKRSVVCDNKQSLLRGLFFNGQCRYSLAISRDRQALENVEQKSSNPYRQLTLKNLEWLIFAEKMEKSMKKSCEERNLL